MQPFPRLNAISRSSVGARPRNTDTARRSSPPRDYRTVAGGDSPTPRPAGPARPPPPAAACATGRDRGPAAPPARRARHRRCCGRGPSPRCDRSPRGWRAGRSRATKGAASAEPERPREAYAPARISCPDRKPLPKKARQSARHAIVRRPVSAPNCCHIQRLVSRADKNIRVIQSS